MSVRVSNRLKLRVSGKTLLAWSTLYAACSCTQRCSEVLCRSPGGCRNRLPEPAQKSNLTFANLFALVKDLVGTDVSLQKDMCLPARRASLLRAHCLLIGSHTVLWKLAQPALLQVALCEPLTDLQRRGEFMSYSELLDQVRRMSSYLCNCKKMLLPPRAPESWFAVDIHRQPNRRLAACTACCS